MLTPKPSLCLLGPVWEPEGEGGRSGQIRLRPWQARLRGGKGLPGRRLYTALCPKKAREFRNECWSTSVQFATFCLFSALGAASLKHYWVEGSETQVPFAGGQAQRPGSSRDGADGRVRLMKLCLWFPHHASSPEKAGFLKTSKCGSEIQGNSGSQGQAQGQGVPSLRFESTFLFGWFPASCVVGWPCFYSACIAALKEM